MPEEWKLAAFRLILTGRIKEHVDLEIAESEVGFAEIYREVRRYAGVRRAEQRSSALQDASRVARWQLAFFYASAAVFKLNSSFLDHRYSCASIYFAQLLDAYIPPALVSAHPTLVSAAIVAAFARGRSAALAIA